MTAVLTFPRSNALTLGGMQNMRIKLSEKIFQKKKFKKVRVTILMCSTIKKTKASKVLAFLSPTYL